MEVKAIFTNHTAIFTRPFSQGHLHKMEVKAHMPSSQIILSHLLAGEFSLILSFSLFLSLTSFSHEVDLSPFDTHFFYINSGFLKVNGSEDERSKNKSSHSCTEFEGTKMCRGERKCLEVNASRLKLWILEG